MEKVIQREGAAHTQGKLEYSESPFEANRFGINVKGHHWLMSILHNGEPLVEVQRENMRRLVACWNACEDIDTNMLEGFSPRFLATYPDRVLAERRALEAQRDELLVALRGILDVASVRIDDPRIAQWDAARAAIAKATGAPA